MRRTIEQSRLAERHEVDDLADPALGEEARHEDGGPGQVELLGRERLVDGPDREAPALSAVEDRAEQAGSVEALGAEPVDRALVADERDGVQVADDAVVLDRQVAVGVALLLAPALRRRACHLGGSRPTRSAPCSCAASAASMAAPTMPARFWSAAGTQRTRDGSSWMKRSASLLMPPPMITRSGQSSASMTSMYSARSLLQACQLRPLRSLIDAAARCSASLPRICRCPSSVFGHEDAVAEERRADAGAERQHEHRAHLAAAGAEAHLGEARRVGVVADDQRAAERVGEEGVGVRADPRGVDVGGRLDHAAQRSPPGSRCRPTARAADRRSARPSPWRPPSASRAAASRRARAAS